MKFMASPSMSSQASCQTTDASYWPSLKQAIAGSSGYQTWLANTSFDIAPTEDLVLVYLRQTLATLAY
jgi:hypothetical protein